MRVGVIRYATHPNSEQVFLVEKGNTLISTWMIYRRDKHTGIRFYLGNIEAQEPLVALHLAAQFYECDPKELVVQTFLPSAVGNPLGPCLLVLDLFVKGTEAYLDACLSLASLLAYPLNW